MFSGSVFSILCTVILLFDTHKRGIMKERLRTFISEITFVDIDTIDDETKLFEEGNFDSMGLLSLITFLDEEMGVKTEDDELNESNFESLNAIAAFMEKKKSLVN